MSRGREPRRMIAALHFRTPRKTWLKLMNPLGIINLPSSIPESATTMKCRCWSLKTHWPVIQRDWESVTLCPDFFLPSTRAQSCILMMITSFLIIIETRGTERTSGQGRHTWGQGVWIINVTFSLLCTTYQRHQNFTGTFFFNSIISWDSKRNIKPWRLEHKLALHIRSLEWKYCHEIPKEAWSICLGGLWPNLSCYCCANRRNWSMLWGGDGGELKHRPVNQTTGEFNPPAGL